MRILLTNDDGINAPGLAVLEEIAAHISDDIWVVAPELDQSGVGHGLSLSSPLRARQADEKRFAINGTPTDCVIIAVRQLMPEPPDLILSGVNSGSNVGDDVTYSGTLAAAMEGAMLGIRSIGLSQAYRFDGERIVPWQVAREHGVETLRKVLSVELPRNRFVNVNFPLCEPKEVAGFAITKQGKHDHGLLIDRRLDGRHFPYHWITFARAPTEPEKGSELEALRANKISISVLSYDLSDSESNAAMKSALGL
jgi:5'-nucleotidase